MTKRLPLLFVFAFGCNGVISGSDKPLPADPVVDEIAADSVGTTPTTNPLFVGGQAYGKLTSSVSQLSYTLSLDAKQKVSVRLGGVATNGSILDTVLYVYGPKDAKGHRSRVALNDDRNSKDLGSALSVTASTAGEYLLIATSYNKPDAGQTALLVGCPDGPCFPQLGPDDPKPAKHLGVAPFANPEMLAYFNLHFGEGANPEGSWANTHVDGMIGVLQRDAREDGATGAAAASDAAYVSQTLGAVVKGLSTAERARLQAALDAYLGTPADFAHKLSAQAQQSGLIGQAWDQMTAPTPAAFAAVEAQIQQTWPNSELEGDLFVSPVGKNGQLYGTIVAFTLGQKDASGKLVKEWQGLETFNADGTYLGDFSLPSHDVMPDPEQGPSGTPVPPSGP